MQLSISRASPFQKWQSHHTCCSGCTLPLEHARGTKLVLNNDVRHGGHDKLDLGRIRGACKVRVDLFCLWRLVELGKLVEKKL